MGNVDAILTLNWKANTYTINYYVANTEYATKIGTSTYDYNSSYTLKSFADLWEIFPYIKEDNTTNGIYIMYSGVSDNWINSYYPSINLHAVLEKLTLAVVQMQQVM